MVDLGSIASLGQTPIQSPTVDRDTQRSVVSPRGRGWDGGTTERGLCVKSAYLLTARQPLQ